MWILTYLEDGRLCIEIDFSMEYRFGYRAKLFTTSKEAEDYAIATGYDKYSSVYVGYSDIANLPILRIKDLQLNN